MKLDKFKWNRKILHGRENSKKMCHSHTLCPPTSILGMGHQVMIYFFLFPTHEVCYQLDTTTYSVKNMCRNRSTQNN